jgi:hypothetical protein
MRRNSQRTGRPSAARRLNHERLKEKVDEDGFIRQRRNIIVVSLLLLFADSYGLTFPELNLLGSRAIMTKPLVLAPVLWYAWVYLLVRYWQAFREQGERKFYETFREHIAAYLYKLGIELARAHVQLKPGQRAEFPGDTNPPGLVFVHYLTPRITGATVRVLYNVHSDAIGGIPQQTQEESFGFLIVMWARIRGIWHVTINTSVVTERYLPFVIALWPVGYVAWKWIVSH